MKKPDKLQSLLLKSKRGAVAYIFILPILIGLIFIYIPSLYRSIMISISTLSYDVNGMIMKFDGLTQYNYAFRIDPNFVTVMFSSMRDLFVNVPVIIIFSFFIANVLNQKFFGRSAARTVFFLPVIIATGILVLAERSDAIQSLYAGGGKLNVGGMSSSNIFNYQGLKELFYNSGINYRYVSLIFTIIDKIYYIVTSSGVQILIFLAGLQSISSSMYEVAKIEGATAWETLWKITFPMISPLILVSVLYTVIETFYSFNNPIVNYINTYLKDPNNFSYGSALSLIYTMVIAVIVLLMWFIINRFIVYTD